MSSADRLAGQKVLITGASGFLGSHLCRTLLSAGAEVHAVSRSQHSSSSPSLRWWSVSLSETGHVGRLFAEVRPDVVFHLSGLSSAKPDLELVIPTFQSLLVSTINVLLSAAEAGCRRIVLAASLTEPQPGQGEAVPASPYAAAKWASSTYGRMFHKLYGAPVVILRTFMTYGPGQNSSKLIPYVTHSLLQGTAPELSSGQTEADWIYVDDVIRGFLAAAHTPEVEGCTIDLGTGRLVSTRAIVDRIVALLGSTLKPRFGYLPDRPFERARAAHIVDAYAKLNWRATIPLETGLEQTVAALRETVQEIR